jgi:hypothetical protein
MREIRYLLKMPRAMITHLLYNISKSNKGF